MGYRELDRDTFLQRNEIAQQRRTGGGQDYFKPNVGTVQSPGRNVLRVLPPHENMDDWCVESTMHFLPEKAQAGAAQRPGQRNVIGVLCLAQFGKACPACTAVARLNEQAKGETDPDAAAKITAGAKDAAAKLRVFANIIDIDHPEKGIQRYAFGPDVQKKIGRAFFDDDGEFRNITHPGNGRDIIMTAWKKPGTTFNDYEVRPKERETALGDMGWLDQIGDLSDLLKEPSQQEIEAAVRGERVQAPTAAAGGGAARPASTPAPAKPPVKVPPAAKAPAAPAAVAPPAAAPRAATPPVTRPPAVKPAAAAAAAPKPTPVPVPPPVSKRQPMAAAAPEPEVVEEDQDPYAVARAASTEAGFTTWPDITPEEFAEIEATKPPCFSEETDPTDAMCQTCRVFLPCLTAKLAAAA